MTHRKDECRSHWRGFLTKYRVSRICLYLLFSSCNKDIFLSAQRNFIGKKPNVSSIEFSDFIHARFFCQATQYLLDYTTGYFKSNIRPIFDLNWKRCLKKTFKFIQ